jgi:hypothetical protein
LPEGFWPEADFGRGRPEEFAQWSEVRGGRFRDRVEFEAEVEGGAVLRVTMAVSGEFRIWRGSSPDAPPRRRESFYLELVEKADRAAFTTTLAPAAAR